MEEFDTRTDYERISDLEARVERQAAQIEGLVGSLAILVTAHLACNNDARLAEHRDYDLQRAKSGGTQRIRAAFFDARGHVIAELLNEIRISDFLRRYWVRSVLR
jgi:hypothetical protein